MIYSWKEIPFVRLLFPFILGIVAMYFLPHLFPPLLFNVIISSLLFLTLWIMFSFKIGYNWRTLFGVITSLFLFFLGSTILKLDQDIEHPEHFAQHTYFDNEWYQGHIINIQPTQKSLRVVLEIEGIRVENILTPTQIPAHGKILAYLPKNTDTAKLQVGDGIEIKGKIRPILPPQNPKAYDAAAYWQLKNVYHQTFIKEENWEIYPAFDQRSIQSLAKKAQSQFIHILQQHLDDPQTFAVGAALIAGDRTILDRDTKSAYADTGAIHVLAVSGLHVGFIFISISFILGWIKSRKRWVKWIKALLLLLSLWAFAFITGGSPSVMRAATMFSFIAIGQAINRRANIFNSLAASAFLLLLIHPKWLFEPGFQLSYLALAGIVYFQPKVSKLWYIKNKIGQYIWNLVSVSIAAQLTTFPLSLYYFHRLPSYFWLSGILAVPLATLILPLGLLLFVVHKIPFLGLIIGKLLNGLIWILNAFIFTLQELPFGVWEGLWIGALSLLLLYLLIITIITLLEKRQAKSIVFLLSIVLGLSAISLVKNKEKIHQKEVVVYHQRGSTVLDIFDGKKALSLENGMPVNEAFVHQNYRFYKGVDNIEKRALSNLQVVDTETKSFLFVNKMPPSKNPIQQDIDYIILANKDIDISKLSTRVSFKTIILDGQTAYYNQLKIKEKCRELGIKCLSTWDEAITIQLND